MTTNLKAKNVRGAKATNAKKFPQVIDLLSQDNGASLEELSTAANWLPHSTRAFLTGLKEKRYGITSEKIDSVRRYRITSLQSKSVA